VKNNKLVKRLLLIFLALIVVACIIVPIPYYIEQPGETINLKELITVNDKKDEHKGSFSLTSVGIVEQQYLRRYDQKWNPLMKLFLQMN
jgi:PDZ domain-containing protein